MRGPLGSLDCAERPVSYAIDAISKKYEAFADWFDGLPVRDKNEVARLIDNAAVESIQAAIFDGRPFYGHKEV